MFAIIIEANLTFRLFPLNTAFSFIVTWPNYSKTYEYITVQICEELSTDTSIQQVRTNLLQMLLFQHCERDYQVLLSVYTNYTFCKTQLDIDCWDEIKGLRELYKHNIIALTANFKTYQMLIISICFLWFQTYTVMVPYYSHTLSAQTAFTRDLTINTNVSSYNTPTHSRQQHSLRMIIVISSILHNPWISLPECIDSLSGYLS